MTRSHLRPLLSALGLVVVTTASAGRLAAQQMVLLGEPGWGTGFGIEPLVGALEFNKKMRLPNQDVVGGLAGLYLGRYSTLRGYYWAGTDTDSSSTSSSKRMESFGGEFEFALPTGMIHPFFLAGGGRVNYVDGFTDLDGRSREDQTSWVVGAGLAVRPLQWLDVKLGYRNTLLQYPPATTWLSNSLFTLGLSLRVGGTPNKQQAAMYGAAAAGGAAAGGAAAAGNMASFPVPVGGGEIKVVYSGDTLRANGSTVTAATITTGTATVAAVRDLVSSELAYLNALYPLPFGTRRTALTPEQADSLTRRIGLRSNGVFDYIMQGQAEAIHASLRSELTARGVDTATQRQVLARVDSALNERLVLNAAQSRAIMIRNDSAYARAAREAAAAGRHTVTAGIGGFSEFYLQGRVSFPTKWNQQLRLAPEVALGFFGGGVSALVAGNALYYVSSGTTKPYFGLGLGVLVRGDTIGGDSGTNFVVNPVLGVELTSASAKVFGKGATGYFIEVQGVNLFSDTRVMAGITWKF